MLEAAARLKERIDRIQAITRYENEAYFQGKRIVDVIKSTADKPEYPCPLTFNGKALAVSGAHSRGQLSFQGRIFS